MSMLRAIADALRAWINKSTAPVAIRFGIDDVRGAYQTVVIDDTMVAVPYLYSPDLELRRWKVLRGEQRTTEGGKNE